MQRKCSVFSTRDVQWHLKFEKIVTYRYLLKTISVLTAEMKLHFADTNVTNVREKIVVK